MEKSQGVLNRQEIINDEINSLKKDLSCIFKALPLSEIKFTKNAFKDIMPKKKIFETILGNVLLVCGESLLILLISLVSILFMVFANAYISRKITELTKIYINPLIVLAMFIALMIFAFVECWKIYSSTRFKSEKMVVKSIDYLSNLSQLSTLNLLLPQQSYHYARQILEMEKHETESNEKRNMENSIIVSFIYFIFLLFFLSFASFIKSIVDLQNIIFGSTNNSPFNVQAGTLFVFSVFVFFYRYRFISWHSQRLKKIKFCLFLLEDAVKIQNNSNK